MSTQRFIEDAIRSGNVTARMHINNKNAIIIANNICVVVIIKDSNNDPVLTYSSDFYSDFLFLGEKQEHLHPDVIKYYNCTEEEIFQYNTVMDYCTLQAMVHLHDYIRRGKIAKAQYVEDSINKCLADKIGQYSINNITVTGGSS